MRASKSYEHDLPSFVTKCCVTLHACSPVVAFGVATRASATFTAMPNPSAIYELRSVGTGDVCFTHRTLHVSALKWSHKV